MNENDVQLSIKLTLIPNIQTNSKPQSQSIRDRGQKLQNLENRGEREREMYRFGLFTE